MNKVDNYKIMMIEQYRLKSGLPAAKVYNLFKDRCVFDYIDIAFDAISAQEPAVVLADIRTRLLGEKPKIKS